jgi:hypothetical protein
VRRRSRKVTTREQAYLPASVDVDGGSREPPGDRGVAAFTELDDEKSTADLLV